MKLISDMASKKGGIVNGYEEVHPRARGAMDRPTSVSRWLGGFTHVHGGRWNYGDPDREHVLSFDEEGT